MPIGIYPRKSAEERFWTKVKKTEGCWIWMGKLKTNGYGEFWVGSKMIYAHRFAYELYKGAISKGLQIDHLCRCRNCVKPEHLEAVTQKMNLLRGIGFSAKEARQTHCKRGHPFDLFNTYYTPTGKRNCRACQREGARPSQLPTEPYVPSNYWSSLREGILPQEVERE